MQVPFLGRRRLLVDSCMSLATELDNNTFRIATVVNFAIIHARIAFVICSWLLVALARVDGREREHLFFLNKK